MPRFAANLTMMYREHNFLDRFAAAARDGFTAVEYLFPYEYPAETLAALLKEHGLRQVLFNAPPGDWKAGERGITALPGREKEFRDGFLRALEYALALSARASTRWRGLFPAERDRARLLGVYIANLAWAAERARAAGVELLIEPIALRNIPGFFLNRQEEAHAIVAEIGAPNLKMLMDLFHCQVEEGDLAIKIRKYLADPKQTPRGPHPDCRRAGAPRAGHRRSELRVPFDLIDRVGIRRLDRLRIHPRRRDVGGAGLVWKWKARDVKVVTVCAVSQSPVHECEGPRGTTVTSIAN